jgi:anti-sigma-K factor RskA
VEPVLSDWYSDEMGWYADPTGVYEWRFFDGRRWERYVIREGQLYFDALPSDECQTSTGERSDERPSVEAQLDHQLPDWRRSVASVSVAIGLAIGAIVLIAVIALTI